jgi:hypothetical protein
MRWMKCRDIDSASDAARTSYNDIAQLSLNEQKFSQHEGPQKIHAQPHIVRHKSVKVFRPKLQDLTSLGHPGEDYGSPSRDHSRFAGERSWAMVFDQPLAIDARLDDLHAG